MILYIKDNNDSIREWSIHNRGNVIIIEYGVVGRTITTRTEEVKEGKATRTLEEQIESRMQSRISKQLDRGYVKDIETARLGKPKNLLGMPKPMLAKKIDDVKGIDYNTAFVQRKLDGNRCMIYCIDGVNKAYSRNGKPIEAIEHILNDIKLEDGMVVDGELYCHGQSLQTIVSWIKRKQPETERLIYNLYDIVSPEPYSERLKIINNLGTKNFIKAVDTLRILSREDLDDEFREYRTDGYEGAILRWGTCGYEDGKRSKYLVKIKEFADDEFVVIDVDSSADGWAILVCKTKDGYQFRVSAPGNIKEKEDILKFADDYIGTMVTVEYSNITADGIPFHPVALRFREEE